MKKKDMVNELEKKGINIFKFSTYTMFGYKTIELVELNKNPTSKREALSMAIKKWKAIVFSNLWVGKYLTEVWTLALYVSGIMIVLPIRAESALLN